MKKQQQLGTTPSFVIRVDDFAFGVQVGREAYEEDVYEEPLTDDEVVQFIAENLCHQTHEKENQLHLLMGIPPISYGYRVGFVVGWLAGLMAAEPTDAPSFSMAALLDARRPTLNAVSSLVVS